MNELCEQGLLLRVNETPGFTMGQLALYMASFEENQKLSLSKVLERLASLLPPITPSLDWMARGLGLHIRAGNSPRVPTLVGMCLDGEMGRKLADMRLLDLVSAYQVPAGQA